MIGCEGGVYSTDYYKYLLEKVERTICVKDYKKYNNGLILRHDVDASIKMAYDLSRIELEYAKVSTYYVLLTASIYNVFSKKNQKYIREMINDGFEIGLHFDPTVYGCVSKKTLTDKIKSEATVFEMIFDYKIKSYSLHQPSIYGGYIDTSSYIDAYNKDIFDDDRYISDSSFSFRGKNPIEYIEKSKTELIQMLIHPQHITNSGAISYYEPIRKIVEEYLDDVDATYSDIVNYKNEGINLKELCL